MSWFASLFAPKAVPVRPTSLLPWESSAVTPGPPTDPASWLTAAADDVAWSHPEQRVASSNVEGVAYDSHLAGAAWDEGRSVLRIRFRSGGVYDYAEVPRTVYMALMAAQSKGSFFNREIKDRYAFVKVQ